jgi:hypothetical protein
MHLDDSRVTMIVDLFCVYVFGIFGALLAAMYSANKFIKAVSR